MTAVEVICLVAATSWIAVVLVALVIGIRVALKLRARRRRIDRLLYVLRLSSSPLVPGSMKEITKIIVSSVKIANAERRSPHWNG